MTHVLKVTYELFNHSKKYALRKVIFQNTPETKTEVLASDLSDLDPVSIYGWHLHNELNGRPDNTSHISGGLDIFSVHWKRRRLIKVKEVIKK